jgi:polygalacturonase
MEMNIKFLIKHITARSAVIELVEAGKYRTKEYDVYINDELILHSDKMVESIYGLKPDTTYKINLVRNNIESETLYFTTRYEFVTLNVRDFGAKGDGMTDDTKYLQAAILSCPKDSRVYVPKGTYRFTNLFLKSNLILELHEEATLLAIPDKHQLPVLPGRIESYDETGEYQLASWEGNPLDSFASLLTGIQVENVIICGRGTIDGCGDFENWWNVEKRRKDPARPRMLFLNRCKNVTVQGVTIRNSPAWNMHPYFSEQIRFIDLTILSPAHSHNTDGIDPESCNDVLILGVHFSVGDDCIAIKSGKIYMGRKYKKPSKNIKISHCFMEKGHGAVTIGSEIGAGVDGIYVTDCVFSDTDRGMRIKTRRGRGRDSVLQNIVFERIYMNHVKTPFAINSFYYCDPDGKTEYVACKTPLPVDERTPEIKNLALRNIVCENSHVTAAYFYGLPEKKIESIQMENIHVTYAIDAKEGKADMMLSCERTVKQGLFARNVKNLSFTNVVIEGNLGKTIDIEEVEEFVNQS